MGKYPNAPIREAVLDIRVSPRGDLDLEAMKPALVPSFSEFAKVEEQFVLSANIQIGAIASQSISPVKQGFIFRSNHQVIQAQSGGFTFSQLAPYDRWETFVEQARQLWTAYKKFARPDALIRLGVRYVNRLEVPLPIADFGEYLRIPPNIPSELPQTISHFFTQYQIPYPDAGALLVLNIGMVEPPTPTQLSILLDIDVFRQFDVPQSENAVWDYFEKLRRIKNDAFEAAITEKMKARFGNG